MSNVQIRDVPDDVHEQLKRRARERGQSLNAYLLSALAVVAKPTLPQLGDRIEAERPAYRGPSAAAVIRGDRDRR